MKSTKDQIIDETARKARKYINEGQGGQLWLDAILKDGFKGFKHMSDEALQEWAKRYK